MFFHRWTPSLRQRRNHGRLVGLSTRTQNHLCELCSYEYISIGLAMEGEGGKREGAWSGAGADVGGSC